MGDREITLKLTIAYDGTRYGGWQTQRGHQAAAPSIQQTIETALQRITQQRVRLIGSGRTDAGVHAEGQVAHCRVRPSVRLARLQRSLNSLLPLDIAIRRLSRAPESFHARYSATRKWYRYRIWNGPVRDPFQHRFVHHIRVPLHLAAVRRAARFFIGRHDFKRFQTTGRPVRSTVRTMYRLTIRRQGPLITMDIEADGFLYRMVRAVAGTLMEIGKGRWTPEVADAMLKDRRCRWSCVTAPACGVTLMRVSYARRER